MSTNNALRKALAAATAVGALVVLAGCANGTHPGAAAVVGNTEISVGQVDDAVAAVTAALGSEYSRPAVIDTLIRSSLVDRAVQRRSITMTPAEIAAAEKATLPDDAELLAKFTANPAAMDYVRELAVSQLGTVKLGGGTVINGPDRDQRLGAGNQILMQQAKEIGVSISPRYGKWNEQTGLDIETSGSLSELSPQTKAIKDAEEAKRRAEQQQPQG